eukprot:2695716-Rhodomonas_salina.2
MSVSDIIEAKSTSRLYPGRRASSQTTTWQRHSLCQPLHRIAHREDDSGGSFLAHQSLEVIRPTSATTGPVSWLHSAITRRPSATHTVLAPGIASERVA